MLNRKVSEYSMFTQLGYQLDTHRALLGLRQTHNELFGNNLSGRISYIHTLSERSSIKALIGQSYRSPSLFELYFRVEPPTVFGNEELQPEKSLSYELAYLTGVGNWFIQAALYHADYDKKIFRNITDVTLPDGSVVRNANVYANGDEFSADGTEWEVHYRGEQGRDIYFNIDYVIGTKGDRIADNYNYNYNFKYVPKYNVSAGYSEQWQYLTAAATLNYRAESDGPDAAIASNTTLDLNLRYLHMLGASLLSHELHLGNVTDEDANIAEYVRRKGLNEVPLSYGRSINYLLRVGF